jgi:hypothetical protein
MRYKMRNPQVGGMIVAVDMMIIAVVGDTMMVEVSFVSK